MMKQLDANLLDTLTKVYTPQELEMIESGFKTESRKTSFRRNPLRTNKLDLLKRLESEEISVEKVHGLPYTYILAGDDNKKLWNLDLIKRGHIYLQSISSQIPANCFDLTKQDIKILDLAAAPGGKTSQIASMLGNEGSITALDNNAIRIDKLNFTLKKQGITNTEVIKTDARNFKEIYRGDLFDAILFDAPCSAEGRINLTNEKSYSFINKSNNKKSYFLQRDILRNNISLLKEGGELVYSTCTISPLENEAIVHFLLCNFPELEICPLNPSLFGTLPIKNGLTQFGKTVYKKDVSKSIRILPCPATEGFFIAKFTKKISA